MHACTAKHVFMSICTCHIQASPLSSRANPIRVRCGLSQDLINFQYTDPTSGNDRNLGAELPFAFVDPDKHRCPSIVHACICMCVYVIVRGFFLDTGHRPMCECGEKIHRWIRPHKDTRMHTRAHARTPARTHAHTHKHTHTHRCSVNGVLLEAQHISAIDTSYALPEGLALTYPGSPSSIVRIRWRPRCEEQSQLGLKMV